MSAIEELYAIVNQVAKEQEAMQTSSSQPQLPANGEELIVELDVPLQDGKMHCVRS